MATTNRPAMLHKAAVVLAAAVLAAAAISYAAAGDDEWVTIQVANKLSSGMALLVHCRSADDDLGGHAVEANMTYSWSFRQSFWGGSVFWCHLRFRDRRLFFTAFDQKDRKTYVKNFNVSDNGVDGIDLYNGEPLHVCGWDVL